MVAAVETIRVGVYLRISKDDDGTSTAPERQLEECLRAIERNGWQHVVTWEDRDFSGSKRHLVRPDYEKVIQAVKDRQINCVLGWKMDRVTRARMSYARLMDALEDAGGFLYTLDGVDTRTSSGGFVADMMAAQARQESVNTSSRIKAKHREIAREGGISGWGKRSLGYVFVFTGNNPKTGKRIGHPEIVEDEAAEIRLAARRLLAGDSVPTIIRDWIARGIVSPSGGKWSQTGFRKLMMSARLSAQREYEGITTPGNWEPILTPDQTARLRAILTSKTTRAVRTYLLTGMVRCGKCGARMVSRKSTKGLRRYLCSKTISERDNCGGIVRSAAPVETVVAEAVFVALDGVDLRQYVAKPTDDTAAVAASIAADEESLADLARDFYADKLIGRDEYFAARDALNARLDANRRRMAQTNGHETLQGYIGAGERLRSEWETLGLDRQRAIIRTLIDYVEIGPQGVGYRFDPETIRIVWRF